MDKIVVMDKYFKIGFEKTAKIYKSMLHALSSSAGPQKIVRPADVAKKLTDFRRSRAQQRALQTYSAAGTTTSAGGTRLKQQRPVLGESQLRTPSQVPSNKMDLAKAKDLNLRLTPRSTWIKALRQS